MLAFLGATSLLAVVGPLVLTYNEVVNNASVQNKAEAMSDYLLLILGIFLFTGVVFAFVYSQRLEIDINKYRLRFRMPPFVKWRGINPADISSFRVAKAKWFQVLRKSRVHYNPFTRQWSYMLSRKYFLEIKLTNGKTLLLSTRQPSEIEAAMNDLTRKERQ